MRTESLAPVPAPSAAPSAVASSAAPVDRRLAAVATMIGSGLSNQVGAAVGTLAFPAIGSIGVVTVRQFVAAIVLLPLGRPRLRMFTWAQWWPVLLLAAVFGTMNLSLYTAIDRVGLGLAVTLEFLGPLAVALVASRRRLDLVCALIAAAAAVTLLRPRPSADYLGLGLGLLAAVCWASYILLNRTVGRRIPGAEGSAAACMLSALMFLPVGVVLVLHESPTGSAIGYAVITGLLSSAVPYLADLFSLRRIPAQAFGLFMSINPLLAALVGWIGLGQQLGWIEWASIGAIIAANTLSLVTRPGAAVEYRRLAEPPVLICAQSGHPPIVPALTTEGSPKIDF